MVLILLLLVALSGFIIAANFAFYGSLPAELPCRNCSGDARAVHLDGFDLYYRDLGGDSSRPPVVLL
ncbi:MAG TPA: hypothetical protein VFF68_14050, partial [Anaerolineaceae bacterium]|nr:hypothetical protein [Anaerolineaceae bacterium]